ncbi:MAG TPA: endolytic transglycosylase MltG [Acidimicrobiales bacterium]|nr:endolytic transglycosylase MltG [Acidimicrobiales bacterium]
MTHPYLGAGAEEPGAPGNAAPGEPPGPQPRQEVEPVEVEPVEVEGAQAQAAPLEEVEPVEEPYDYLAELRTGRGGSGRRRRRRWPVVLLAVLLAVVVIALVGFLHVNNDINPPGKPGRTVMVAVPAGTSDARAADLLAKDGVIHGSTVFEWYLRLKGVGTLVPGTYQMATNEPYSTALYILQKGPLPVTFQLVVPEGFTVRQIAAAVGHLKGAGISEHAFLQAATGGQVRSAYQPTGSNDLEGLLFPATYPVQQGETADELVQYMVATFDSHAAALGLSAAAQRLGYSPYQVITVASIVEREVKFEADRGGVASVIYNRLVRGIPIGAESTLLYGLGEPKGPVAITTPNPYNTLVNKGLPPTPISNPGIPSLEAAMNPPKTTYLYWVEINPDGATSFASNEAQFRQLQAECRAVRLGC